jgi:hypothetical protein
MWHTIGLGFKLGIGFGLAGLVFRLLELALYWAVQYGLTSIALSSSSLS